MEILKAQRVLEVEASIGNEHHMEELNYLGTSSSRLGD